MSVHAAAPTAASHQPNPGHTAKKSSGDDDGTAAMQGVLDAAQKQYVANFEMTEQQAMDDNNNSTFTTIASGHQQEATGATASARTVGEGNAHIMA